jgi:hypothetical protein
LIRVHQVAAALRYFSLPESQRRLVRELVASLAKACEV